MVVRSLLSAPPLEGHDKDALPPDFEATSPFSKEFLNVKFEFSISLYTFGYIPPSYIVHLDASQQPNFGV
jgi:hypothetical protein